MKNRFLSFLKKYYCLVIFSLLHPLAMATADIWGGIRLGNNALGPIRTYDIFFLCFEPLLHFAYGCIAYLCTRKILLTNAIPIVVYFAYVSVACFEPYDKFYDHMIIVSFFVLLPIAFALLGTLITTGLYKSYNYVIRRIKGE